MTLVLCLLLFLTLASPDGAREGGADVGQRIGASYAAAQALQGPLDGSWKLCATTSGRCYLVEIIDPPGGAATFDGAWSLESAGGPGDVTGSLQARRIGLSGASLTLRGPAFRLRLILRRAGRDRWQGFRAGRARYVMARRPS